MLCLVHRVKRNAHAARARLLQRLCHRQVDQCPVRAEHGDQTESARVCDEFEDVGARQGLSARENHDAEARLCDLAQELLALLRRELLVRAAARVAVAVRAVHIARVRRIPRDDLHPAARNSLRVSLRHPMWMDAGVSHTVRMSARMSHRVRMPRRCVWVPAHRALCGVRRLHRGAHRAALRTPISSSVR